MLVLLLHCSSITTFLPWVDPEWSWSVAPSQISEVCLKVPTVSGTLPNTQTPDGMIWTNSTPGKATFWTNNSRLLALAVPEGTPPPTGWPVLLTASIIPFDSMFKTKCDAPRRNIDSNPLDNLPPDCSAIINASCPPAVLSSNASTCAMCLQNNVNCTGASPCNLGVSVATLAEYICPTAVVSPACINDFALKCPTFANVTRNHEEYGKKNKTYYKQCHACVTKKVSGGIPHCPKPKPLYRDAASTVICGAPWTKSVPKSVPPFISPAVLAAQCSCINGTNFTCGSPSDDGHHGGGFIPKGGACDTLIFFGALWHQRLVQALLSNGIAVMLMNPYTFDGWTSYPAAWDAGYDAVAFDALNSMLRGGHSDDNTPEHFQNIDPDRIAVRGFSGGSQMVSWLIEATARIAAAKGANATIGIKAGVFMSGGSYACYNAPPYATGSCANCDPGSYSNAATSPALGCSNTFAQRGLKAPYCELCCPQNFTEAYYAEDTSRYATHPATLFGQVEIDEEADSCASVNYHNTMIAHGAHSEMLTITKGHDMRCYALGLENDSAVPKGARGMAHLCDNPNMTSIAHTEGFADFVSPAVQFFFKAFNMKPAPAPSPVTRLSCNTTMATVNAPGVAVVGEKLLFATGSNSTALLQYDPSKAGCDGWSVLAGPQLSTARGHATGVGVASGRYALWAGGETGAKSNDTDHIDILDVKTGGMYLLHMSVARSFLGGTSHGHTIYLGGGELAGDGDSAAVDVLDLDTMTMETFASALSVPRKKLAAATAGDLVLFGGGYTSGLKNTSTRGYSDVVDVLDTTTKTWSVEHLSQPRQYITATSLNRHDKAVFAGGFCSPCTGQPGTDRSDVADVFDARTKTWTTHTLSQRRSNLAITSVGGRYAVIGGGTTDVGEEERGFVGISRSDAVDVYDAKTNAWSVLKLSAGRCCLGAAGGNLSAAFCGGTVGQLCDVFTFPSNMRSP